MIDVPRLKHQDRGLCRVDAGAIKRKIFGTPHEDDVGFDVVEDSRLVPEMLPREEHDGVIGRHDSRTPAHPDACIPESGRYSARHVSRRRPCGAFPRTRGSRRRIRGAAAKPERASSRARGNGSIGLGRPRSSGCWRGRWVPLLLVRGRA